MILRTIQNEEISKAVALFCQLPTIEEKVRVVLDSDVKPKVADSLVSGDCQNNTSLVENADVLDKLKVNCNLVCQQLQNKAIEMAELALNKTDKYFSEKENVFLKNIKDLKKYSEGLIQLSSAIDTIREAKLTPAKTRTQLKEKIKNAFTQGYLRFDQYREMNDKVTSATEFDPAMASCKDITSNTIREINIQRDNYLSKLERNKGLRNKARNHWENIRSGFKALSDSEKLEKGLNAVSVLFTAIGKFKTHDPAQITSGVLDLANLVSGLLPPPASMVTGFLSGIVNMFALGGDPSNQDVIDSIHNGFEEQKSFISEEFVKQNKFIKAEFAKQNIFISRMFDEQKQFILDQTKSISKSFAMFKFDEVSNEATGLMEDTLEKLCFIESFMNGIDNDFVATQVSNDISVMGKTDKISKLRAMIEQSCKPQLISCDEDSFKQTCLFLIYSLVIIEKYRNIALLNLINVLQPTNLKQLNEGYLNIQKQRKETLRLWILSTLMSDEEIACIISYKRKPKSWSSKTHQKEVVDFISYIDISLKSKLDNINDSYCKDLEDGKLAGPTCELGTQFLTTVFPRIVSAEIILF